MSNSKLPVIGLLVLQVIAFLIYTPSYLQRAPQAAVLPPALLLFFVAALIAFNAGALSQENTRNSLVFLQGLNLVVRLIMLFPNLKTPSGDWAWGLLIAQLVGMGLSWYTMVRLDKVPLQALRFTKRRAT